VGPSLAAGPWREALASSSVDAARRLRKHERVERAVDYSCRSIQ